MTVRAQSKTAVDMAAMELARQERLAVAVASVGVAVRWCRHYHASLETSANYHHWRITHGARVAEWWPLKARLVLDGRSRRARTAPDWTEVSVVLVALWALKSQQAHVHASAPTPTTLPISTGEAPQ